MIIPHLCNVIVYYSEESKIILQSQQIQLTDSGIQINEHKINYDDITTIGNDKEFVLLLLKAKQQETDDDQGQGQQIIYQLSQNVKNLTIQGGLAIQIEMKEKTQFIKQFQQLQRKFVIEPPQDDIISSEEENDDEENDEEEYQCQNNNNAMQIE